MTKTELKEAKERYFAKSKARFSLITDVNLGRICHKALDNIAHFSETAAPFLNLTELS